MPRTQELAVLPEAVEEVKAFHDYAATLGASAPAQSQVVRTLDAARQWSGMRTALATWDAYCAAQEGAVWRIARAQMRWLKPTFDLAVNSDPSLAETYGKLAQLLSAQTVIAKKGASTKALNKKATAEGKLPAHGKSGKALKRATEQALLVSASTVASALAAVPSSATTVLAATPVPPPTPAHA